MRQWYERVIKAGACAICMSLILGTAGLREVRAEESAAAGSETEADQPLPVIRLTVGNGQDTPVYSAGEKTTLEINVVNSGNTDAENVRMEPVIQNAADWPFEVDRMNYENSLGTIPAGQQASAVWGTADSMLTVKDDVSGKPYKLVFHLTYDDGGRTYETDRYIFVKTKAEETQNEGENAGEITPAPSEPAAQGEQDYGPVYNGEPTVQGGSGGTKNSSVPRVIVTGFDTQPGEVKAGTNFKLTVHLKNTSGSTAVSNLLIDMQAPSSGTEAAAEAPAFLPSSGSSSIYLESIPAGGTSDISIDLNARADLIKKPYSISMNMKYEDSSSVQYEAQSSLAIPVIQQARFEFSKIQLAPDTVQVGEETNVSCSLYNLGRVKMYNVKAHFEGAAIEEQEQFIGNLDSGATGNIDVILAAKKEAPQGSDCRMTLTYEDDSGNAVSHEQTFKLTVIPAQSADETGMIDTAQTDEHSGKGPVVAIAVILFLAAGAGAAVFLIRRRKKKLEEIQEEELSDEVERFTEDEY